MGDELSLSLSSLAEMKHFPHFFCKFLVGYPLRVRTVYTIWCMIAYTCLRFCYIAIPQFKFLARLKHNKPNKATLKVTITKGTTSSRTSSSGGSTSFTVSGELGASILKIFSANLGLSRTTGFDWSSSSSSTSVEQVSHEVTVEVNENDEVLVYQVIGECKNSDGTKYTLKTGRYETKGKGGETLGTSEIPPEEGSKWA